MSIRSRERSAQINSGLRRCRERTFAHPAQVDLRDIRRRSGGGRANHRSPAQVSDDIQQCPAGCLKVAIRILGDREVDFRVRWRHWYSLIERQLCRCPRHWNWRRMHLRPLHPLQPVQPLFMRFAHEARRQGACKACFHQCVGQQQRKTIEANINAARRRQCETVGEAQLISVGAVVEIGSRPLRNGKKLRTAKLCKHHYRLKMSCQGVKGGLKISRPPGIASTSLSKKGMLVRRRGHHGHKHNHKPFRDGKEKMARSIIPFPEPGAEAHAHAETERKRKLFAWADALLQQLGLAAKVAQAQSLDELRKFTLDIDDLEVEFAIRDALHPAVGQRAEHFTGVKAGTLKRLLKMRFGETKKDREAELLHGRTGAAGGKRSSPHSWTNDLKLDAKGGIRPILTNLILFLREHPTWKGV